MCFSPAGRAEGQGGQEEHKASFFPRWLPAGDAAGSVLDASSLPVQAAARGQLRSRAPGQPRRRRFIPGSGAKAPGLWVHTCPPAAPGQATALGRAVGQLGGQRQRRQGRAAAFTGRARKSWVRGSGKRAGRARQRGSRRAGLSPPRPQEGSASRAEMPRVRNRAAGLGMRSETTAQGRPHSPRKSRRKAQRERGGPEPWEPRRVLPASPAAGPRRSNATRGGTSVAEQLHGSGCRRGARQGPGAQAVLAGCQGRAQPRGTQQSSTRRGGGVGHGAGVRRTPWWRGVQSSHLAAARAGRGLRGSSPWPSRWEAGRGRRQRGPEARLTWDPRFLSGPDRLVAQAPPGSPRSDTQRRQRPRAGDLLEAVGSTHPDEVFL